MELNDEGVCDHGVSSKQGGKMQFAASCDIHPGSNSCHVTWCRNCGEPVSHVQYNGAFDTGEKDENGVPVEWTQYGPDIKTTYSEAKFQEEIKQGSHEREAERANPNVGQQFNDIIKFSGMG